MAFLPFPAGRSEMLMLLRTKLAFWDPIPSTRLLACARKKLTACLTSAP